MNISRRKGFAIGGFFVILILVAAVALIVYFALHDDGTSSSDSSVNDTSPIVSVEQGLLRGEWVNGAAGNGSVYAAFRWIPYAQAPVGALRFKAPRPALKWDGIRNATVQGNICFQYSDDEFVGSEDCLFLNVYTPKLPSNQSNGTDLLPVLFFIHGGSFTTGSSSESDYGPDFLITQDIIVVTTNYRLNVFGFMNFQNDVVPGNVGLKDQIFALEWVQLNIKQFGGDPKKVTIQGQSAGAASVHWLTLLPETEGLFRAAILESGSAIQEWGYMEKNMQFAKALGKVLAGSETTLAETSKLVMELSAEELFAEALVDYEEKNSTEPANNATDKLSPSPQRLTNVSIGEERLILRDSESYVLNRSVPDVPILMGINNREWLLFYYDYTDYTESGKIEEQIEDLITYVPLNIIPYEDTQRILGIEKLAKNYSYTDIADYLKEEIFDVTNSTCDTTCKFKRYQDRIFIENDMTRLARLRARHSTSKTYLYKFAVKTAYNINISAETAEEKKFAACHGDELVYLYSQNPGDVKNISGDGLGPLTLRRMIKMWANFVKYLDPTPELDSDITVKWKPYNVSNTETDTFLHIGEEFEMREENLAGSGIDMWLELYEKYRDYKSI